MRPNLPNVKLPTESLRVSILWLVPLIVFCAAGEVLLMAYPSVSLLSPPSLLDLDPRVWMFAAALLVPLIWRYRYPRGVFVAVAAVAFVQWAIEMRPIVADLAVLVALFAVCRLSGRTSALAALGIAELGVVLSAWSWRLPARFVEMLPGWRTGVYDGMPALLDPATFAVMFGVGLIGLGGLYASTRRRLLAGLEERAIRAERERDQQATIAAAAERARIAREMHDVIAHNVSAMVVYAEGGRLALRAEDAGNAHRAFDTIWQTGRTALAEMRRQLGVLREGDDAGQGIAPQPDAGQIPELVRQMRASGLDIVFDVLGTPPPMSPGVQLTLYRVVQESLTNVMKHAGSSATCRVMLVYDDAITVTVEDDGRGASSRLSDTLAADGAGQGLVGMRERVSLHAGTVDAAPMTGGGFLVHVRIPRETRT